LRDAAAARAKSDFGVAPVFLSQDRDFVNNYIFQKSGDSFNFASDLGANPTAFLSAMRNFRSGQRFQAYFEVQNGRIVQASVNYVNNIANAGTTKDPCRVLSPSQPETDSVANGARFLSPSASTISQVAGARVGLAGQSVDTYLNDRRSVFPLCGPPVNPRCFGPIGQTTPWIWNQIEFDLNGNLVFPIFGVHTSIFSMPWYTHQVGGAPIYIKDFRSLAGQNMQNFIDKDITYRFTIPTGAIQLP
jgi:hypothetical protein